VTNHNAGRPILGYSQDTSSIYYNSPAKKELNIEQATKSVVNVLSSMVLEMEEAMRCLGKASLKELSERGI
jgi:hypothetical protein